MLSSDKHREIMTTTTTMMMMYNLRVCMDIHTDW